MLQELQKLLGGIYDVPLTHDVSEFLLTDRERLPQAVPTSRCSSPRTATPCG
jgi:hypothetical protein